MMRKEKEIEVLVVEAGKHPYVETIENTLWAFRQAVGGLIEMIGLDEDCLIIGNDESKLMGLPGNRRLRGDILAGTFLIVGSDGDEFISLSEKNQVKYAKQFWEPEEISMEEVADSMHWEIIVFK